MDIDLSKIDYFTEEGSVDAVVSRTDPAADERLKIVWESLVKHVHAFTKEVELKQEEWDASIDFLTRTGQMCDENRQEFILLSDVIGLSMLTDAINNRDLIGATESTVRGPFHVAGSPELEMSANISLDGKGESCLFEGRVVDKEGNPIEAARLDVWCDNADGYYDVQQPDLQPKWNNRGIFTTGPDGVYKFKGAKPVTYPIPYDGPVGQLLKLLGRHPNRPAHMHYIVSAPGFKTLVTHTFVGDDKWLTSDAVFGVKSSLIAPFVRTPNGETEWHSPFDFVMVSG